MVFWWSLLLISCGSFEPAEPYVGDVQVFGLVRGWDGTGDVAIEACGAGTLVEPDGGFAAAMDSQCELRVVWERNDHRARGPWQPLKATGPVVKVVLEMPDAGAMRPLSQDALREKAGYIRSAQRQLDADVGTEQAPEPSRDY
jgi:hypothetical protein